jgi:hypothetical protein
MVAMDENLGTSSRGADVIGEKSPCSQDARNRGSECNADSNSLGWRAAFGLPHL